MRGFCAAIGGFLFGYDTSVISGALLLLKDDFNLNTFQQEIIVSLTVVGAFFGSLIGGVLASKYGRRPAIFAGSGVFIAGAALLAAALNYEMLAAGRFVVGIGVGIAATTVPVYISEASPAHIRGMLTVINTVCISSGQLIANVVDALFGNMDHGWRYMFGISAIPAIIQLVGFLFLPESPRYLVSKNRVNEARHELQRLRGKDYDVEPELALIQGASAEQGGLRQLLAEPHLRRILLLACMLQVINQVVGINTIMYYSATILQLAGISDNTEAMWISAAVDVVFVAFTVVGLVLVERAGRRPLMLYSLAGVFLSTLVLAQAFYMANTTSAAVNGNITDPGCGAHACVGCLEHKACGFCATSSACLLRERVDSNTSLCAADSWYASASTDAHAVSHVCPDTYSWLAILGMCLYLASFAFGVTSMPWAINAEIFPTHLRSAGASYATATNWLFNLGVSLSFLTLTETITSAGTFWLYGGISIVSIVYIYYFLPETKGKTLEEIEDVFRNNVSARGATTKKHDGAVYHVIQ